MSSLLRHLYLFVFVLSFCFACGTAEDTESSDLSLEQGQLNSDSMSNLGEIELTQQLPLELDFSNSEKERYRSILGGIYQELTEEDSSYEASDSAADPTASCDRCGRETGFLPSPDLYVNQFLHVDMKSFTFGLVAWDIDLEAIHDVLEILLSNEVPEVIQLSHRLTVVRVDVSRFNETMETQASEGILLSEQSPDSVSITSVTTADSQFGLNLDHGYSYILFVNTVEGISKLSSLASEPVLLHCFTSDENTQGGCLQLNSSQSL